MMVCSKHLVNNEFKRQFFSLNSFRFVEAIVVLLQFNGNATPQHERIGSTVIRTGDIIGGGESKVSSTLVTLLMLMLYISGSNRK